MNLWQGIVGIFTAVLLICFRNAYVTAQKQKLIAIRLRSYLLYWNGLILDNDGMFDIFYLGVEWSEEIRKTIKKGGDAKDLVKLKKEKKKLIDEIEKIIKSKPNKIKSVREIFSKDLDKVLSLSKNGLLPNPVEMILELSEKNEQKLLDGKTFISDEDASYLGIYLAQICVELKMNLILMINQCVDLILNFLSDPENFDLEDSTMDLSKILWQAILVSRDIYTLTNRINIYTKESLPNLTLKNMWSRL